MHKSAQRTLWWGIGLFIAGGIALVAVPWLMGGLESVLNFNTVERSLYIGLLQPIALVIQYGTFPLGAALIAASVVIRHINRWVAPQTPVEHVETEITPIADE